jgi:PrcB C-terminal
LGRKSSSGYSVEFVGSGAISERKLTVQYSPKEPSDGSFQAMAITYPCAYAQINTQAFDHVTFSSTKRGENPLLIRRNGPAKPK